MSQFYLTLPSNSYLANQSGTGEPEINETIPQLLSKFRVQLPQKVRLEGDWEVALSEIMYPHSWFNINKGDALVRIKYIDTAETEITCELFPNKYSTPEQLIQALNFTIDSTLAEHNWQGAVTPQDITNYKVSFTFQKELRRVVVKVAEPRMIEEFHMSPLLSYMLGFEESIMFLKPSGEIKSWVMAEYPVDLKGGFYALYVYCDLVENQVVGNSLVPLLRTVTIEGQHEEVVCKIYNTPHYLPLARKEFDSIEISINDDQNRPVKFQFGKVIVKLAFRKQKPFRF